VILDFGFWILDWGDSTGDEGTAMLEFFEYERGAIQEPDAADWAACAASPSKYPDELIRRLRRLTQIKFRMHFGLFLSS